MAALEQDNSSSKEIQQLELRMKREIMRLEKEVSLRNCYLIVGYKKYCSY